VEDEIDSANVEAPGETLRASLKLRDESTNVLRNRENSQLEFKESFNLGSLAKYSRTIAAFANNRGGHIVFGVEPSPHRLKGVNRAKFDECDPAQLTQFLNSHFSPEILWEMDTVEIFGVRLGYIYTSEADEKPIVTVANANDIKNGDIYFRYKGQSSTIRYPELRAIIDARITRERQAWLQHLRTIERVGPRNVGILDTIHGKLYGAGPPFLIDEKLLRKLKFIRRGRFSESEGEPTLRVLGDVQSVTGIEKEKPVPTGIHSDDLMTAFLAQRPLDESEARAYLREASYQNTPYLPIHYFIKLAGLSRSEAQEFIKESNSTLKSQKKNLIERIAGAQRIKPIGTIQEVPNISTSAELERTLDRLKTEKERRSVLLGTIRRSPKLLQQFVQTLPLARLSEAVTHLDGGHLQKLKEDVFELLLSIFANRFQQASGSERTVFRKAVAFCDENLS
jgi:hypothetical protein